MKRAHVSMMLLALVILSGCGPWAESVAPPLPPIQGEPVPDPAAVDPEPSEPEQSEPAPPAAEDPEPTPAIRWYSPGIGFPLVSDDPAAKGIKAAMLTFDDGPHPEHTPRILDILKELNVKAMFFITGYGARNLDLVERIHREGHTLAVHSQTHANLSTLSEPEMRQELEPVIAVIEQVTGARPRYCRPPYGAYNDQLKAVLLEYGLELINWSHGSLDWDGVDANGYKEPQQVISAVVGGLHPGAIILMHDTLRHTAEALPELIRQIRAEGYTFVVLP